MNEKIINLGQVCKNYGIRFCSYEDAASAVDALGIDTDKKPGVAFRQKNGTNVILFDNTGTALQTQFTVAHELGHILLGHLDYRKSVHDPYPAFAETEANYFAVAILVHNLINKYGVEEVQEMERGRKNATAN